MPVVQLDNMAKNKQIASSIDMNLFNKKEHQMKPDKDGVYHIDVNDPNYKYWNEDE